MTDEEERREMVRRIHVHERICNLKAAMSMRLARRSSMRRRRLRAGSATNAQEGPQKRRRAEGAGE